MLAAFGVAMGGALGSLARYVVSIYVGRWLGSGFPWATLVINITGSFLIGALVETLALRWDTSQAMRAFLVVGLCGGYTTFSTFSLDVAVQLGRGATVAAALYVIASLTLSVAALYAAMHLMRGVLN